VAQHVELAEEDAPLGASPPPTSRAAASSTTNDASRAPPERSIAPRRPSSVPLRPELLSDQGQLTHESARAPAMRRLQVLQQRLRLDEVVRVEALGEPVVDRGQ
jgi:hypothetical protein